MILEIDENYLNIELVNALLSTNRKVTLQKAGVTRNFPALVSYRNVIRVEVEDERDIL